MAEKRQLVEELHKPVRTHFQRRKVVIKGINDLWTSDLAEMIPYARENDGFKYILVVVNCFTKFAYAEPLKNKTAKEVVKAFERIITRAKTPPKHLWTDQGSEFIARAFQKVVKKHGIKFYFTYQTTKASISERFLRTLKSHLWKEFSFNGNYRWVGILPKLIKKYNSTVHSTIKMRPKDVKKVHEKKLLKTIYNYGFLKPKKKPLEVGTLCRISRIKGVFEKKYLMNWSTEVFKIHLIQHTNPITYLLKDLDGEPILGSFYREELQPTSVPDIYLVEKVVKKKGDKYLVKWLGFKNPQWIDKDQFE